MVCAQKTGQAFEPAGVIFVCIRVLPRVTNMEFLCHSPFALTDTRFEDPLQSTAKEERAMSGRNSIVWSQF